MALDTTECPIQRPSDCIIQRLMYSGKSKKHSLKYEVGVSLHTGAAVWIFGPSPGSIHDPKIARSSGILNILPVWEQVLADKAYIGEPSFLLPLKGNGINWRNGNNFSIIGLEVYVRK